MSYSARRQALQATDRKTGACNQVEGADNQAAEGRKTREPNQRLWITIHLHERKCYAVSKEDISEGIRGVPLAVVSSRDSKGLTILNSK